ncbi:hypothetical protein K491DRAFT_717745 [Lophiostoma macrostomum CBS 122681]|uniref:WSC domain-containing protein n=1 Tax=Lophiostoma macrostomum CBS 122681 TaxID=1314788 RepID=A0A6A6T4N6_9PLEO|nr:hypothetical protein K491DRAFT_717745 [Lophiostoma macrostomum CBS 122681]
MIRRNYVEFMLCFLLPVPSVFTSPSVSHASLQELGLLPYGSDLVSRSANHLEIRGVVDGRQKRYIIKRDDSSKCCRDKTCKSLYGEFLDGNDRKCKKCPTGQVPAVGGTLCQNDCPSGTVKTPDGNGCCPQGQKQNPTGDACEHDCGSKAIFTQIIDALKADPSQDNRPGPDGKCPQSDDDKKKRKGKCRNGFMLDPKEGPQDENAENPICTPDDDEKCPSGQIAETRKDGDTDPNNKKKCAQPDDNNRKQCDTKKYYIEVTIQTNPDGSEKAVEKCKTTRQYEDRKKGRMEKFKVWKQISWEADKEKKEAEKKAQEEADRKAKEEQDKKDDRKKRTGKCLPVVALMTGIDFVASKRSVPLARRDDEHPYSWTTDYFDEDFVQSDDILTYWPSDLGDFDPNTDDLDKDDWLNKWSDMIQGRMLKEDDTNCEGTSNNKHKRCPVRRDVNIVDHTIPTPRTSSAPLATTERGLIVLEDRQSIPGIVVSVISFLVRLASIFGRFTDAVSTIAKLVPRLAGLTKDNIFNLAKPGKGASGGREAMKNAAQKISQNKNWKNCLQAGEPI